MLGSGIPRKSLKKSAPILICSSSWNFMFYFFSRVENTGNSASQLQPELGLTLAKTYWCGGVTISGRAVSVLANKAKTRTSKVLPNRMKRSPTVYFHPHTLKLHSANINILAPKILTIPCCYAWITIIYFGIIFAVIKFSSFFLLLDTFNYVEPTRTGTC